MKTKKLKMTLLGLKAGARAFTLTELLVVIGLSGLVAAVLLSAAFTTKERVMRAQCVNNLRQIGVGLSLYATEANGCAPICYWPQSQNPWLTYEVCRVDPANGTNIITIGLYNLALLFRTRTVPDPRIFYCPSLARLFSSWTYDYYATPPHIWPSTPAGSMDDNVRTGYNYYPQLRATERLVTPYGVFYVPVGALGAASPAKLSELDPRRSITTDLVHTTNALSHRAAGIVAGLNALFPDGRVTFQNARTDTRTDINSPWYNAYWANFGPGNDPRPFRIIMSEWRP